MMYLQLFDVLILVLYLSSFFQIFHTPEGMLSSERGVYVAETVAAKNTKQAKGRFRVYEDQDGMVLLCVSSILFSSSFIFLWHGFELAVYDDFVPAPRTIAALIILQRGTRLVEKWLVWGKRILGNRQRNLACYLSICHSIICIAQH